MADGDQVISIEAATDWWSAYKGDGQLHFHRIIVFALVENEEGRRIEPIDRVDVEDRTGSFCSDSSNFLGLFHTSDFEVTGYKLKPAVAANRLEGKT